MSPLCFLSCYGPLTPCHRVSSERTDYVGPTHTVRGHLPASRSTTLVTPAKCPLLWNRTYSPVLGSGATICSPHQQRPTCSRRRDWGSKMFVSHLCADTPVTCGPVDHSCHASLPTTHLPSTRTYLPSCKITSHQPARCTGGWEKAAACFGTSARPSFPTTVPLPFISV